MRAFLASFFVLASITSVSSAQELGHEFCDAEKHLSAVKAFHFLQSTERTMENGAEHDEAKALISQYTEEHEQCAEGLTKLPEQ